MDHAGKEALGSGNAIEDVPPKVFTGPQVAQGRNTTQLVHVRWSGSTVGGTSKRGQNPAASTKQPKREGGRNGGQEDARGKIAQRYSSEEQGVKRKPG